MASAVLPSSRPSPVLDVPRRAMPKKAEVAAKREPGVSERLQREIELYYDCLAAMEEEAGLGWRG